MIIRFKEWKNPLMFGLRTKYRFKKVPLSRPVIQEKSLQIYQRFQGFTLHAGVYVTHGEMLHAGVYGCQLFFASSLQPEVLMCPSSPLEGLPSFECGGLLLHQLGLWTVEVLFHHEGRESASTMRVQVMMSSLGHLALSMSKSHHGLANLFG